MGDVFSKLPTGASVTRFSITVYNEVLDMLRWWKTQRRFQQISDGLPTEQQPTTVLILNNGSSDVDQFGVLGIDGPLITPAENLDEFSSRVALTGSTPATGTHDGKFAIAAEPIAQGSIGKAWVSGVCPAKINIVNAGDLYADIVNGDTTALTTENAATGGGAQILWANGSGDATLAIVRIGEIRGIQIRSFELKDSLAPGDETNKEAYAYDVNSGVDTDTIFSIVDMWAERRGRGRHTFGTEAGSQGWCFNSGIPGDGYWYIIDMQPAATLIYGQTTAAVGPTDDLCAVGHPSFYLDHTTINVKEPVGGLICDQAPAANLIVYNISGLVLPSGANVEVKWNEHEAIWETVHTNKGPLWGTLAGTLSQGSYADVTVDVGGTNKTILGYDKLLKTGTTLANGSVVKLDYFPLDAKWYVTGATPGASAVQIRWNDSGSHKLEYSNDGGTTWTTIDTAVTC